MGRANVEELISIPVGKTLPDRGLPHRGKKTDKKKRFALTAKESSFISKIGKETAILVPDHRYPPTVFVKEET